MFKNLLPENIDVYATTAANGSTRQEVLNWCFLFKPGVYIVNTMQCFSSTLEHQPKMLFFLTFQKSKLLNFELQCHCYNFVHDVIKRHWDTILEAFFHFCFAIVIKFLSS
jgi:hypothetical protein